MDVSVQYYGALVKSFFKERYSFQLIQNVNQFLLFLIFVFFVCFFAPSTGHGQIERSVNTGNYGLPNIISLPTAYRLPEGEIVINQQIHKSLARSGISFQALPRLGLSFRYTGHGIGGGEAYGRVNHDRSFDAHISILEESNYLPAISVGLRDFIGTGWYTSEYIVGSKSFRNFELSVGLGFGRLAGKNTISNPFAIFNKKFENREKNNEGVGGTFGTLNWYQGNASPFYGISYIYSNQLRFSLEYSPDLMERESSYMSVKSPLNFGMSYQINNYLDVSAQFLHGSQFSLSASVKTNPNRPPLKGGKDLAPVPMRKRNFGHVKHTVNQEQIIKKVLDVDGFEIHYLGFSDNSARIDVTNTKFRSTAQAVGRISSTLQRFTSDSIKTATISFRKLDLQVASYTVDLEKIANEQFNPVSYSKDSKSILAIDAKPKSKVTNEQNFSWGLGPYIAHRLFNPDLPLSMETGLELKGSYKLFPGLRLSGELRKSVLTNLTDNQRRSNSTLHRVHSDWPLYDFAGQDGHIHTLKISYLKNISSNIYARAHAGWLEPFFAGVGGEILFKPAVSPIALGIDVHYVQKRDYQMMFNLRDYKTTLGHVSLYYDAGGIFEVEINAGRYLAGDWGATTTISRKFGNGWEVGGYATLTDVPFDVFGEGSFDKAIYVSVPLDWIISSPNKTQRRLTLRPITRDGGAQLASSRKLYRFIEKSQNSQFKREFGRLWK